jgi:hypothetical protein
MKIDAVHNPKDRKQQGARASLQLSRLGKPLAAMTAVTGFVLWAHFGAGVHVFRSQVSFAPGWQQFRASYGVEDFGEDSYFTRAVQNGYNLFYFTHEYGTPYILAQAAIRPRTWPTVS